MFALKRSAAAIALVATLSLTLAAQDSGLDIRITPNNGGAYNLVLLEGGQTAVLTVQHRNEHSGMCKLHVGIAPVIGEEIMLEDLAFLFSGAISAGSAFQMKFHLPDALGGTYAIQALALYEDGEVACSRVLLAEIKASSKAVDPDDQQPLGGADGDAGEPYSKFSEVPVKNAPAADKEPAKEEPAEEAPNADKAPVKPEPADKAPTEDKEPAKQEG